MTWCWRPGFSTISEVPDQLDLLRKCKGVPLILDTHVSLTGKDQSYGYDGSWYEEGGPEGNPLSSWGNSRSFWPTFGSLERMLTDAGYGLILAQVPWYHGGDRTFFVCLP